MTSIRQSPSTPSTTPRQRAPEKAPEKPSASLSSRASVASSASRGVSSFTPAPARPKPVVLEPVALRASATAASLPVAGGGPPERLITKDFLNLRSVPSQDGNAPLATIPPGAELQVTPDKKGATHENGYVHVAWNDNGTTRTGWVAEAFTQPAESGEPATPTVPTTPATPGEPATAQLVRATDALNLRSMPSQDGNTPLAVIPRGTQLQVTPDGKGATHENGYVHVAWNDNGTTRTGWVSEAHVRPSSAPTPGSQTDAEALDSARSLYINQFDAELQVSGDGRNANCGPTSVVMALRDQGLSLPGIPGVAHDGSNGADVQVARYHMYNGVDASRDGVVPVDPNNPDAGYQYAAMSGAGNENSTYTDFSGVKRAVEQAGGTAEYLSPNAEGVAQALREGKAVVVAGNFVEEIDGVKQEKTDTWTRGGGAEEHLVAITGLTEEGNFIVCDPAHPDREPIIATPEELEAFMRGNAAAMSVAAP